MISVRILISFLLFVLLFSNNAGASESVRSAHLSVRQELSKIQALANRGDVAAQLKLATMYYSGQGATKNHAQTMKRGHKAAEKSDAGVNDNLGLMYALGKSVPQNYAAAWKWRHKAAEKSHAMAKNGRYQGVPQNYAQALKWALIAKAEGDHDAIHDVSLVEDKATPAQIARGQGMARRWLATNHLRQ